MSNPLQITLYQETWPIDGAFTIARGSKTAAEVVVVTLSDGEHVGRGECLPYARYGESVESVIAEINAVKISDRSDVRAMKPGAARNAVDCAYWDLRAQQMGKPAHVLAGYDQLHAIETAYTLTAIEAEAMEQAAMLVADVPLLKIKLLGKGDTERLKAARAGAPSAKIMVDANEGLTTKSYQALLPLMEEIGVIAIEQPFPADGDEILRQLPRPIPVIADESAHTAHELKPLFGKYDMVNIKLDKTGGLSEGLHMLYHAREMGFGVMVGCMVSTSLSVAPAFIVAQEADIVDLDGALLLARDRPHGMTMKDGKLQPPSSMLWG